MLRAAPLINVERAHSRKEKRENDGRGRQKGQGERENGGQRHADEEHEEGRGGPRTTERTRKAGQGESERHTDEENET